MFLTFTARSNSVQRSLISEKGLLNDSLKIQGKTLEEKFSNPFSPFSWCLFVHAFSVFPSNSRNSSREVTSLVCKPHRSLMVSISLGKSSSSFMIPGSILSEESWGNSYETANISSRVWEAFSPTAMMWHFSVKPIDISHSKRLRVLTLMTHLQVYHI